MTAHTHHRKRSRLRLALSVVALVVLGATLAGCGSGGSDDKGVAALPTSAGTTTETDTDTTSSDENPEDVALEWAACMRKNGVNVPDPQFDAEGHIQVRIGGQRLGKIDQSAFQAASKECGSPLGASGRPAMSDEQRQEVQETMLEFAACMREHGVDMPDPKLSSGGMVRIGPGSSSVNPESPGFREAQKACEPILQDAFGAASGASRP